MKYHNNLWDIYNDFVGVLVPLIIYLCNCDLIEIKGLVRLSL